MIKIPEEKPLYLRVFEYAAPDLKTKKIEIFRNLWTVAKDKKDKIFIEWRVLYADDTRNVKRLELKDSTTLDDAIKIVENACSVTSEETDVKFDRYYYLPENLKTAEEFAKVLEETELTHSYHLSDKEAKQLGKKTSLDDVLSVIQDWVESNDGNVCFIGNFVSFRDVDYKQDDFIKEDRTLASGNKGALKDFVDDLNERLNNEKDDFINW